MAVISDKDKLLHRLITPKNIEINVPPIAQAIPTTTTASEIKQSSEITGASRNVGKTQASNWPIDENGYLKLEPIDVSKALIKGDQNDEQFAAERIKCGQEIVKFARKYGFLILKNHGVDDKQFKEAHNTMESIFQSKMEDKIEMRNAKHFGQRGMVLFGEAERAQELHDLEEAMKEPSIDFKEYMHIGQDEKSLQVMIKNGSLTEDQVKNHFPPNKWPDTIQQHKGPILNMYQTMNSLGTEIMELIGLGLGQNEESGKALGKHLRKMSEHGNSIMRLIHYPKILKKIWNKFKELITRAARHYDLNLLTLLYIPEPDAKQAKTQSSGGLQLNCKTKDSDPDNWISVRVPPGCILANIGDSLSKQTGLRSTEHRVVMPDNEDARNKARYSIPFFLQAGPDDVLRPLPGAKTNQSSRINEIPDDITASELLRMRLHEMGMGLNKEDPRQEENLGWLKDRIGKPQEEINRLRTTFANKADDTELAKELYGEEDYVKLRDAIQKDSEMLASAKANDFENN